MCVGVPLQGEQGTQYWTKGKEKQSNSYKRTLKYGLKESDTGPWGPQTNNC